LSHKAGSMFIYVTYLSWIRQQTYKQTNFIAISTVLIKKSNSSFCSIVKLPCFSKQISEQDQFIVIYLNILWGFGAEKLGSFLTITSYLFLLNYHVRGLRQSPALTSTGNFVIIIDQFWCYFTFNWEGNYWDPMSI